MADFRIGVRFHRGQHVFLAVQDAQGNVVGQLHVDFGPDADLTSDSVTFVMDGQSGALRPLAATEHDVIVDRDPDDSRPRITMI